MTNRGKRVRIDFILEETEQIGETEKGKIYRFRMVPDPKSWEHTKVDGESGYLNKFTGLFISDEEMAKSVKTMKGIPITLSKVGIKSEEDYIKKSKNRLKKNKNEV